MSGKLYNIGGAAFPTTAALAVIATGTGLKTLIQVATPSTEMIKILGWGIDFRGFAAAEPGKVELIQTDVAATGGTGLTPNLWGDPGARPSLCVSGAALTCFGPSGEGTITATRLFAGRLVAPSGAYENWFALGREPWVGVSKFLRIRVHFAATVDCFPWILWEE